jgi:tetratricopeptide (TPR) repeat protein
MIWATWPVPGRQPSDPTAGCSAEQIARCVRPWTEEKRQAHLADMGGAVTPPREVGEAAGGIHRQRAERSEVQVDAGEPIAATTAAAATEPVTALQQLLVDRRRVLGPDAPDTLTTRSDLARWLGQEGRHEEAIAALRQLLVDRLRVLGADAPDTLTTRFDLAYWLGEAGREEAVAAYQQLVVDRRRVLGPDAPDTLTTRYHLAYWLASAGRLDEAITTWQQLLDQQRVLGPDASDTLTTGDDLAHWLAIAGRLEEAIAAAQQLLSDQLRAWGARPTARY